MHVFVTGAAGFVGTHLLPDLVAAGHTIRALRLASEQEQFVAPEVTWIEGDLTVPESFAEALQGCDAVVHLAGVLANRDEALNDRVNNRATADLARLANEARVGYFLCMSAAAVKFKKINAYGRSKLLGEQAVVDSDLSYSILRTPLIIGQGCDEFERFVDFVNALPLVSVVFGDGASIKRPVWIGDVIQTIVALLERQPHGFICELAGPEETTLDQFIDAVAKTQGRSKLKLHLPLGFSLFMARLAEAILGDRSPVTRDILLGLNEDVDFQDKPCLDALDIAPLGLVQSLARVLGKKG